MAKHPAETKHERFTEFFHRKTSLISICLVTRSLLSFKCVKIVVWNNWLGQRPGHGPYHGSAKVSTFSLLPVVVFAKFQINAVSFPACVLQVKHGSRQDSAEFMRQVIRHVH